ncbi:hypothetical protein OS176_05720 [Xanthomonadaceae bacterium XH05]|nr:hypothetical protein [Xanthomonadaceae bacterium XH05]
MSESPIPMPTGRDPLPRRTTPTWEMELLISGATVFSLMQAPDLLDRLYYGFAPRLEAAYQAALILPYMYLMTACLALIATFLMHLCVRGYWVALVGLASVYPEGVNWKGMTSWGPSFLKTVREQTLPLDDAIERYDNRASQVFGFGVGLTFMTLGIAITVVVMIVLAVLVHELSGRQFELATVMIAVMAVFFVPYLALYSIDSFARTRSGRYPRLERFMDASCRSMSRLPFVSGTNYPLMLFVSHAGGRRGNYLMVAVMLVLLLVSTGRMETRTPMFDPDGYSLLPADNKAGRTLDPRHYADQRVHLDSLLPAVHIPSEEIQGDWLRVFIPFRPTPDTLALKRLCPALGESDPPDPEAVLACLPQRYILAIDGMPVSDANFDFGSEPRQQLRGVVARIDIRDLSPGRHEVSLRYGDMPTSELAGNDPPERPALRIPFWR